MKKVRHVVWLLPLALILLSSASVPASAKTSKVDRGEIERLLRTIEKAISKHDTGAVLAVYDPADPALVSRTKSTVAGWFALDGLAVSYRLGALTGGTEMAEGVIFRSVAYREHDRRQLEQRWETVRLRRVALGWKILSESV